MAACDQKFVLHAGLVQSAAQALEHIPVLPLDDAVSLGPVIRRGIMLPLEVADGSPELARVVRIDAPRIGRAGEVLQGQLGRGGLLELRNMERLLTIEYHDRRWTAGTSSCRATCHGH